MISGILKSVFTYAGLYPTEDDLRLRKLVAGSYRSVRVVGRGTVRIDPDEVNATPEMKDARKKAKAIVAGF